MLNMIKRLILIATGLMSSTSYAHTGFHAAGLYHPLTGMDHFLAILIIALLAGLLSYYLYKR